MYEYSENHEIRNYNQRQVLQSDLHNFGNCASLWVIFSLELHIDRKHYFPNFLFGVFANLLEKIIKKILKHSKKKSG